MQLRQHFAPFPRPTCKSLNILEKAEHVGLQMPVNLFILKNATDLRRICHVAIQYLSNTMSTTDKQNCPLVEVPNCYDQTLRENLSSLKSTFDDGAFVTVEALLHEVRSLQNNQRVQSRFRRVAGHLQPIIDFLMMYSPALDLMVQFDPNPSVLVWGSVKFILQARAPNSMTTDRILTLWSIGPLEYCPVVQICRVCISQALRHPLNFC